MHVLTHEMWCYVSGSLRPTPPARASCPLQMLVAFILLDTDADGKLSFEEVTMYMAGVLRVVCAVSGDVSSERRVYVVVNSRSLFHARCNGAVVR